VARFSVIDAEQRSEAWFMARSARLTSSYAKALFAAGKGKEEAVGRRDLRVRLAIERITGRPQEDDAFVNAAMQRGVDKEAEARLAYEAVTGTLVRQAGFLAMNDHMAGTSLDGYLGDFEGVVELKCPKSATHIGYLQSKGLPADYLHQIRHHVWVTGAQWADFVSFDDRLPEHLQLVIYRVTRAELDIPGYEATALAFLKEVEAQIHALNALRPVVAA